MKRIKTAALALAVSILFTACSKPENNTQLYNEARVEYDIDDSYMVNLYEDNVYSVPLNMDMVYDENFEGEKVSVFDGEGKLTRELALKGIYTTSCWDIYDDTIYLVSEDMSQSVETGEIINKVTLYSADIQTGETKELYEFQNISRMKKIRVIDNKLYWLGKKKVFDNYSDVLYLDNGDAIAYDYSGNAIGCYDLSSGANSESDIPFPEAFSERNGRVIAYAFEKEKGYCFCDFAEGEVLCYTNKLNQITDFEFINDNLDYIFLGLNYAGTLSFSGMDDTSGIIQLDDNIWANQISVEGDYICVQGSESAYFAEGKIFKYLANVSTADPPIRVVTSSMEIAYNPLFSCGYQVKTDMLSRDSFALTVLSLDKDYDLAMMSTNEGYAGEMKEKGSFYPLNDVPGVQEYIDSCFPYIKDAATNENGEIWMLPVALDIPTVVYNQKNCGDNGISFSSDFEEFIKTMEKTAKISNNYSCERYSLIRSVLNSYLSENNSFDTEVFRNIAETLKEKYNSRFFNNYSSEVGTAMYFENLKNKWGFTSPDSDYYTSIYDEALFYTDVNAKSQETLSGDENLLAAPLPTVSGKNNALCKFICVNPNSEHLAEALLFIERTVSRFADKENSFNLKDKALYSDDPYTQSLYSIYENAEITFNIPEEVYEMDFNSYINGEIDLESFITEADRKLSAYLNE